MKVAVRRPAPAGRGAGAAGTPPAPPQFYTVPAQREITIKDLLTHTSGLGSGPMGNSDIEKIARKDGETLAQYIPRLGGTALEFQPGSRWTYSPGAGFETLGRVIEIASGMPLDRFFRTRIFDPLGMKDITFWPTDAQMPRVATVYSRDADRSHEARDAQRHDVEQCLLPRIGRSLQHGRRLLAARHHARRRRRDERQAAAEPQDGGDDVCGARARHAARPSRRRRLRPQRARRHQPRGARHDAVGWHVRMDRRAGHALLRRSEGGARRRC